MDIVEKLEVVNERSWKIVWCWVVLALVTTIAASVWFDFPKETIILSLGVVTNVLLYKYFRYKAGGIIAMPLFALYSLNSPTTCIILLIIMAVVYIYLELIFNKIVMYGRRLYLNACLASIFLTILALHSVGALPVYMTVIPGVLAYNLHFDGNNNGHTKTLILVVVQFLFLFVVGKILLMG